MLRDLLVCERRLGLDLHGDTGDRDETSPFVKMLWANGLAHEASLLSSMAAIAVDLRNASRADRERGTVEAVIAGAPVILGSIIVHDDLVGMPDVLISTGRGHVAADVKAGAAVQGSKQTYKPEYLVQVSHYAYILGRTGLGRSDVAAVIDVNGEQMDYDLSLPFGQPRTTGKARHLVLLDRARDIREGATTRGALAAGCSLCDWRTRCRRELTAVDDLSIIPGIGRALRDGLEAVAPTVSLLAQVPQLPTNEKTGIAGIGRARLNRFIDRARLMADPTAGPVARRPVDLPCNPHAVDFDVEADPVRGLVYLHGFWHEQEGRGRGRFIHFFAETADAIGERDAFARAIEHFQAHNSAHWYHYSAYEKTAYRGLQRRHPDVCSVQDIETIFEPSRCTDLYEVISTRTDWPLSSYSIKSIAKSCGFAWSDVDPSGAASVEWFDRYVQTGDPTLRERIIVYNRDDVRASARVRQALNELDRTGRIAGFRRPT